MDRFVRRDLLGYGTYSMVYEGYDKINKTKVALKIIKLSEEEGMPNTALREISIMKGLSHKNILSIQDILHSELELVIVLSYIDTDLKKLLLSGVPFSHKGLIKQLIEGVAYLHSQQIVHRDLKPQNILVDKNECMKIADFGLARSLEIKMPSYSSEVVTLWYRSPELLKGVKVYGYSIDIWSVGCIISEILTGNALFSGTDKQDQLVKISRYIDLQGSNQMEYLLKIHAKHDPIYSGLIFECLKEMPEKRITAQEALNYLNQIE
ncbi:negative regulator of the PHO system [Nematocida parisii]|nr:negative regulator of the PHO system [Nematocida parisii]KAI5127130.1 negative regulator of the PHO system [Nematocida parisii]KAI5140152.1 negative regulator of the PHO system [Nematocida parisii]KAI5143669.1 negative regulator of the PHO system [Nematocida parisii]KAI5153602.1 negative regulator of the PHO system [Nematocida parisii]